jgi:hypothetical protein
MRRPQVDAGVFARRDDTMCKVEEIEEQIQELSGEEFAELREWFLEQDLKAWDAQIEADAKSGRLDKLVSKAKAEYESGRARKL